MPKRLSPSEFTRVMRLNQATVEDDWEPLDEESDDTASVPPDPDIDADDIVLVNTRNPTQQGLNVDTQAPTTPQAPFSANTVPPVPNTQATQPAGFPVLVVIGPGSDGRENSLSSLRATTRAIRDRVRVAPRLPASQNLTQEGPGPYLLARERAFREAERTGVRDLTWDYPAEPGQSLYGAVPRVPDTQATPTATQADNSQDTSRPVYNEGFGIEEAALSEERAICEARLVDSNTQGISFDTSRHDEDDLVPSAYLPP